MKARKNRKGIVKVLIALLTIFIVIALIGIGAVIWDAPARAEIKKIIINEVDFTNLKDGVYTGEFHGTKNRIRDTTIEVTVESGAVTKISVTEGRYAGDKASEEIAEGYTLNDLFKKVIDSRTLEVDAVSGATLTTNVYLKSIENALQKAQAK